MDTDSLQLHIDFALVSLYGKIGAAGLQCEVTEYSKKTGVAKVACVKGEQQRVWTALGMMQSTMDGQYAMRISLNDVS